MDVDIYTFERMTMTPIDIIWAAEAPKAVYDYDMGKWTTYVLRLLCLDGQACTEQSAPLYTR